MDWEKPSKKPQVFEPIPLNPILYVSALALLFLAFPPPKRLLRSPSNGVVYTSSLTLGVRRREAAGRRGGVTGPSGVADGRNLHRKVATLKI